MQRFVSSMMVLVWLPACAGAVGTLPSSKDSGSGLGALTVSLVVPEEGPTEGGTPLTIQGSGFTEQVGVEIGGAACGSLVVLSAVELTCTTPGGNAGVQSLTATRGEDGASASVLFTYTDGEGTGGGTGGTGGGSGTGSDGGSGTGGGTSGATVPVDYCHLQYPCSQTLTGGAESAPVYVWVYQGGVTEGVGQGAGVSVEIGVGPDGSDPAGGGWTWSAASYNTDKDGLSPLANDEYEGAFFAPGTGNHDFCGRVSADGGLSWTLCDGGGSDCNGSGSDDGYSPSDAGQLTVSP